MGLFSYVINSCDALGPELMGTIQSKDLESLMDTYWLSPDGCLYRIDDSASWTLRRELVATTPGKLTGFTTELTGEKGRVTPYRIHGTVRFTGNSREAVAWFKAGVLDQVLCCGPIFSCEGVDRGPELP